MDMATYRNRPDWTSELRLHNGTIELIKHCGTCLSIIPETVCIHCTGQADAAHQAEQAKLKGGE